MATDRIFKSHCVLSLPSSLLWGQGSVSQGCCAQCLCGTQMLAMDVPIREVTSRNLHLYLRSRRATDVKIKSCYNLLEPRSSQCASLTTLVRSAGWGARPGPAAPDALLGGGVGGWHCCHERWDWRSHTQGQERPKAVGHVGNQNNTTGAVGI